MDHEKQQIIDKLQNRIVWLDEAERQIKGAIKAINRAVANRQAFRVTAQHGVLKTLYAELAKPSGDGGIYSLRKTLQNDIENLQN